MANNPAIKTPDNGEHVDQGFFAGLTELWNDPGDRLMLLVGIISLVFTVLGLVVVFIQVKKSVSSADSAKKAADEAKLRISSVNQVLDFSKLQNLAIEIVHHIRSRNWSGAALRSNDLRLEMARQRQIDKETKLLSNQKWQAAITNVAEIESGMFDLSRKADADVDISKCARSLLSLGELFSGITAVTTDKAQGIQ